MERFLAFIVCAQAVCILSVTPSKSRISKSCDSAGQSDGEERNAVSEMELRFHLNSIYVRKVKTTRKTE